MSTPFTFFAHEYSESYKNVLSDKTFQKKGKYDARIAFLSLALLTTSAHIDNEKYANYYLLRSFRRDCRAGWTCVLVCFKWDEVRNLKIIFKFYNYFGIFKL